MLLSCQVYWENTVDLDKKGAHVSVGYIKEDSRDWLILATYLQIVLNLDTARAEVLVGVVELCDAVKVGIGGQMNRSWCILVL